MKECSIQVLAEVIEAEPTTNLAGAFTGVSTDSRTTQPGECFFAIVGDNFDGHDYVSSAFANGAVCAVVGKDISVTAGPGKCILRVRDTIKALGDFARWYRKELNFKVAAITGSVGKTTTREITYHVLSNHFRVVQSPGSFNNNIGLPLTILLADPQDQIIVAEIGSNHPGEISCLTRIALPDIAVITNIYPAHLEGFGNLNAIMREKLSICEGLPPDGILIVNAGFDELVCACREKGISFKTFGGSALSAIRAADITHTASESTFTIEGVNVLLPLPGPGNVENALAAWAVCRQFGLSAGDFARAAKTLPRMQMRSELLQLGTLTILNDCYNANPASMKNALDTLANIALAQPQQNRRLVFICGDMAELGRQSRQLHAELGRRIAHAGVNFLITIGQFAQVTAEAAENAAEYNIQTKCLEDTNAACNSLKKFVKDYDIILVKGSRVAGLERIIERLKELFG